jgi:hypothetical protein
MNQSGGSVGDVRLIPIPDNVKAKVDVVAVPTTLLGYFQSIPWPELAAAAACLYTLLRIAELIFGWVLQWRKK